MDTYEIKDDCRKNLNKYTIKAFSIIPSIENPEILDIGCGTGIPSLALIEICNGVIYAIDPDESSLNWFKKKVNALNLNDRIRIIHGSIFNSSLFHFKFDIILAEGSLNVIGFNKGLAILISNIKNGGYLLIHNELRKDSEKRQQFKDNNLKLLDSFELGEDVWWNEYYRCLEMKINSINNDNLFIDEIKEINEYKTNPENFKSIYYILQNES